MLEKIVLKSYENHLFNTLIVTIKIFFFYKLKKLENQNNYGKSKHFFVSTTFLQKICLTSKNTTTLSTPATSCYAEDIDNVCVCVCVLFVQRCRTIVNCARAQSRAPRLRNSCGGGAAEVCMARGGSSEKLGELSFT